MILGRKELEKAEMFISFTKILYFLIVFNMQLLAVIKMMIQMFFSY